MSESVWGGDGGMNLPYEEVPGGPIEGAIQDGVIATGIVVKSLVVKHPETGKAYPAISLQPTLPNGEFMSDIVLVLEEPELRRLVTLVSQGVAGAFRAARAST